MRWSRLGPAAFSLVLLAAGTVLTACPAKEVTGPMREAKPGRVEVTKDNKVLGFVLVTPGAPGKLELSDDSAEAKALEALWNKEKCSESVAFDGERRTKDGAREHYTTRVPSTSPDYGESVRWFLIEKGYQARFLEGPATVATAAGTAGTKGGAAGEPTSTAGPAPAPVQADGAKPERIEVKKGGAVLGFVLVTPGAPGKLELSDDSAAAKALEALWNKEKCGESVAVPAERATKEGVFEHNTRVVPSTSPEYGSAVRGFLLGRGYDVRALEAAAAGPGAPAGPALSIPELPAVEKELRAGIPAGSGDYAKVLALATLHKRGTISFKQLEEAIVALKLPPHKLGDGYLMTPSPVPPPGVKWDPKMMPTDWQGTWGEVAMAYHLGELTRDQYKQLHKAAHPTGCKL